MTVCWSTTFSRSPHGAAVFDVAPDRAVTVLTWAARQHVATLRRHALPAPVVQAWAVLDGGVVDLHGYGLTTLPGGVRVIGFAALRLLIAELDLAGPDPFDGETVVDPAELRRAHRAARCDARAVEQVELLATCQDALLLRWVAATLAADDQAGVDQAGQGRAGNGRAAGLDAARSAR